MAEADNQNVEQKSELMQFIEDGKVTELLFKDKDGAIEKKSIDECKFLTEGYCGVYFSAHWCPPCRGFTPKLAEKYAEMKEKGFTIIFASWDQDEAAFNGYFNDMPWAAFPFDCNDALKKSKALPDVNGIPTLYLFNKGELYETGGRGAVMTRDFPYTPEPYYDVEKSLDGLNESACVLLMMPNVVDENKRKKYADCLVEHASEQLALKNKRAVYHFTVTEFGGEKIGDKLQEFTTVKEDKMVILWFDKGFYQEYELPTESKEVSEAVESYLKAVEHGDESNLKKLALPGR